MLGRNGKRQIQVHVGGVNLLDETHKTWKLYVA